MAFINAVIFISLTFVILAFLMYTPLPEDFEEPWIYRIQGGVGQGIAIVVEDLQFEGVPVRVYKPKALNSPAPCIIYFHGGGWVLYNIDTHDSVTTNLALETGMIVISVDYRLAPEHPYPASLEDGLKVTKFILQDGRKHGVDVNRVAVAGESAGGTMATVISLILSGEDAPVLPPLKLQVLLYPLTQFVNFQTLSYQLYKYDLILSKRLMSMLAASYFGLDVTQGNLKTLETNQHITPHKRHSFYRKYFKEEMIPYYVRQHTSRKETVNLFNTNVDTDIAKTLDFLAIDPYASPLLWEDLSHSPPAYVVVAEFDILRDDGLLYVDRLREAGVEVELSYAKGHPHLFMAPRPNILPFKGGLREWEKLYAYLKENM